MSCAADAVAYPPIALPNLLQFDATPDLEANTPGIFEEFLCRRQVESPLNRRAMTPDLLNSGRWAACT